VIRIEKPAKAPAVLERRGKRTALLLCAEYESDSTAAKSWKFDSKIYAAKSVKSALQKAQHDKCAFCESKITHVAFGDVEHFRPKAGYRKTPKDALVQPGYYWLAYDWGNLLFCCQICNQRHKRNHFPLFDESQRAKSHHDDIKGERPLFIHPAEDDPRRFLEFNEEYVHAIDGNQHGSVTIDALGLNRDPIVEKRRDWLALIQELLECRELLVDKLASHSDAQCENRILAIDTHLNRCASDSAEYAAMVRAALMRRGLRLK
jgi:uncharacterized protein (TIGR02646 family)